MPRHLSMQSNCKDFRNKTLLNIPNHNFIRFTFRIKHALANQRGKFKCIAIIIHILHPHVKRYSSFNIINQFIK